MLERMLEALALPSFLLVVALITFVAGPMLLAAIAWIVHDAYAASTLLRKVLAWLRPSS